MRDLIDLQKKLYPDLIEVMQQRYTVLHYVDLFQPIGRRGLVENTKLSERSIRGEIDFLQSQGLIEVTSRGMYITKEGKITLDKFAVFNNEVMGIRVLESQLKEKLHIKEAIVIQGNSDLDEWVKQEMGKACVTVLRKMAAAGGTIAVTGGTTMAAVADVMTPLDKNDDLLFVPARGGMDEKVEYQANTIAATMAKKTNSDYRLLYVPDPLSEATYQTLLQEPSIKEKSCIIKGAAIIVHGIGDALTMAKRRRTTTTVIEKLEKKHAVSEAFGYYFDKEGRVVHQVRTIGIQLEDLKEDKHVITIAGGASKGAAIVSYFKQGTSDLFITDEAAAREILRDKPL
ncbi:hypothetical protein DX933_08400 [Ornithinibacillus gellani]|uniref:sugar-binding transcriptional regulator n=1 Tax=Ornithinibacillus gellani TaxID=2293253 RepID=UPI000F46E24B|nr:sugar-binding domain-containing protein [Ornithinibacillus gellani]TQS74791.1 hypothetical protein DX933_08400 [Ornithinibacillus gellani]